MLSTPFAAALSPSRHQPDGDAHLVREGAGAGRVVARATTFRWFQLDCRPKITDFGLAKRFEVDSNLTHSEAILGTGAVHVAGTGLGPIARRRAGDRHPRVGVILCELLTGQTPFKGESLMRTLDRVRFEVAEPPSRWRAEVPPAVDAICAKCLAKEPGDRYATADDLADDLRRFLEGAPLASGTLVPRHRRSRRVVTLLAVCLRLLAVLGGLAFVAVDWWSGRQNQMAANPVPATLRTRGESFAFLVGVRSYRLDEQSIELAYTESDVDELSRVLLKQGYPRRNIRLLTQWSEADNPELRPRRRTFVGSCGPCCRLAFPTIRCWLR